MFEFDESKSLFNKAKHGIDFVEVQALWDDPNLLEVPAKTVDEPRSLVISRLQASTGRPSSPARGQRPHRLRPSVPGQRGCPV